MKTLLEKQATEPHAAQAIELFCYIARKHIGALSARWPCALAREIVTKGSALCGPPGNCAVQILARH